VNVFAPAAGRAEPGEVERYAAALEPVFRTAGVEPGEPVFDDDGFEEKVRLLGDDPPGVVSFTFGCPPRAVIESLRAAGADVWVTVTTPEDASAAAAAGATGLVVQGTEAGGHRGSWVDGPTTGDLSVLALLQLAGARTDLPMIAAGGIATGGAVAAVLVAGAAAAQVGTAFMRCPEAGTSRVHREALAARRRTALTRAFTGRSARGIENEMMREYGGQAPRAYPEVHHVTAPLRAHGRRVGDAEIVNLWAGQTYELAEELPAAEVLSKLHREARAALKRALERPGWTL
jgi:nitronate monooxygenase